jgi:preprotein translocase subunit YajC
MHDPLIPTFVLQEGGGLMDMLPMLGIMFVIFYFLLIRPQNKEKRQQQAMRAALKKGDKVLTQGGIVANIRDVKETEIVLDIDGSKMRVVRDAVIRVLESKDALAA